MFFTFPDDASWNAERQAVEFGVEIGEYRDVVRMPRRVFQRLLAGSPTPERCVEAYCLQRTPFESIAMRKIRRRQLLRHATHDDLSRRPPRRKAHSSTACDEDSRKHHADGAAVRKSHQFASELGGIGTHGQRFHYK